MNSLRRRRDFVFRTSSSGTQDPDINVYLRQSDMKNSLSFDIDVEIPVTATTRVTAELNIEYLRNAGSKHTETYPLSVSRTCGTEGFVGFLINDYNVSKGIFYNTTGKELKFPFENLTLHKFEYTVEIHDDGNYSKYEYIYDFTFFETPVRLNSNFTFDTNIGPGDRIYISNLTLDHILDASGNPTNVDSNGNIIDDTHPESVDNNGNVIPNASGLYINNSQQVVNLNGEVVEERQYDPFVIPAFKFTFQPSDDPNSNASDNTYNNEYNDLYEPRVLEYNANGSYILPANTLPEGTYTMKVLANWADGYYRTKAATSYVHVIQRPVIKSVTAEPLYVKNLDERVVTIAVSGSLGDRIWFNFYDSSGELVAKAGDTTGFSTVDPSGNYTIDPSGNKVYELSLNNIKIQNNSDGILVGVTYAVKAETKYTRSLQPTDAVRLSDSRSVIFPLKVPVVGDVTEYSVQSDGGAAAAQTIATVSVNTTQYYLYAPNVTDGIKFYIYDEGVKVASTVSYDFLNVGNSNMYTITLDDILLEDVNTLLANGKDYTLTAEVTLTNHAGDTETRESTAETVRFSDRIAPVLNLVASNTWELASNFAPSSYTSYFNNSPLIGISGHFKKTAQFNSQYANQLDTELTKFRIEFSLNEGVSWNLVKRAVLSQKLSSESTMQEAINRVRNLNIVEREDGKYDNIPGTIIGHYQEPLVFYIPQYQGDGDAFDETNEVKIRVTVVDTANLWGEGNEAEKISSQFQLINRINTYSFTNDANTARYDIDSGSFRVFMNGTVSQVPKSYVVRDSNPIIEELEEGWRVVNTGPNTNGAVNNALPKVNLYYYGNVVPAAQQNSSNSFIVSQINGMGAYAVIDQHVGALEYPFFIAYTTPTGSLDKASWYKSKLFYAPSSSGNTTIDSSKVGPTLLYTGTDDAAYRPDIPSNRRVKLNLLPNDGTGILTNANATYATEKVNLLTLHTSSNANTSQAGSFNFTLSNAGLMTSSSVLSSYVMTFNNEVSSEPWNSTDSNGNLRLNVPVDWQSIHAHSVKVGYKYSLGGTYTYITFNSSGLPVEQESKYVSFVVNPASGTTLYYSVAYIVDNTNLTSTPLTTQGLTAEVNVPNKHFPMASDYTVTSSDYQTFNTDGQSSISFQLAIAPDSKNRLDGVNVYFTSTDSTTGSGISKVRIGSYAYSASGSKDIPLLLTSGGNLHIMNDAGVVVESELPWDDYDMANITFEAFRDARVNSTGAPYNSENTSSDPVSSDFYVESGTQSTFGTVNVNPIWNVPVLTRPADDASADNVYILSGGVINMEDGTSHHVITWPTAVDSNELSFSYDLKVTKNDTTVIVDENDLEPNSYVLPIDLNLAKYTIEVTKVFNGLTDKRELSPTDTIIFYSIEVDTSAMAVSVQNPSNSSSVTLSWGAPDISGNSVTASGYESSSFGNNISTQYIQYRTTTPGTDFSGDYSRLDVSGGLIEQPSLYNLPNQALGTLYEFVMYVEAQVKFSLNGTVYSTQSETDDTAPYSTSHDVPLTPRTQLSQYIVSTVPSVESLPHSTPVLVQGSSNPTLLLNLNANGLEHEGFISVVVILTQDGTDEKPEGEQALLIFPDLSGNHPLHPFSSTTFVNTVTGVSGVGAGDVRLAGGESATSTPRNVDDSVLSTQDGNNSYTLTIGTVGTNRRYGLSRLQMPPTSVSGFVSGSPVNYMIILTTRRGTDIGVGEFTYQAVPSVSNVTISTINGQFFVDFVITPA